MEINTLEMLLRWLIVLLILPGTAVLSLKAQTIIYGKVVTESHETLPGTNIYIEGTYDGTSSDAEGSFSFTSSLSGSVIIKASFLGFKDYVEEVALNVDSVFIEIILYEHINYLNEVVISAGTFEAGSNHKSEVLQPLDIVTTAGVTADIAGALNTLPGTQTVGEEGRLFVRGGDAYETTTFIDGMIVRESYDISAPQTPTRSRFSPFMFSGTSFSTGGYSAEYGQGLSSALILNTKDVATETRTDFSLMSVGLEAAHTQLWDDASFAGKASYINLDPYYEIIRQDFEWIDSPTSIDASAAFRKKVGKNGLFKTYSKFNMAEMRFNHDPFTIEDERIDMTLNNKYGYLNSSYKDVLSKKWILNTGLSYTYSDDDILMDEDIIHERSQGFHLKSVAGYEYNERIFLRMGGEWMTRAHFQDFNDFEANFENRFSFNEDIVSSFLESKVFLSKSFLAKIGGRVEYNSLSGNLSLDPRASLALKTGDNAQFSMAYGIFRQSPPDQLLRVEPNLIAEKSTHFIVNYQWMKNNRTFRIEAYDKRY
ncbi:MAG: TonB-dependent receptor, partial [Saprospiraceae bacterium]|nr:TonB-dependent receptor [Saprospiraceae bacterium]